MASLFLTFESSFRQAPGGVIGRYAPSAFVEFISGRPVVLISGPAFGNILAQLYAVFI